MKRLDFINKKLRQKNEAKSIHKQFWWSNARALFSIWKKNKPLALAPHLSDFYHASEGQKNGELLFVKAGAGLATCALYKYFEQMTDEKLNEVYYQPDHLWTGGKQLESCIKSRLYWKMMSAHG